MRIVPLALLRRHEMPEERRVRELEEDMKFRGVLLKPIVVDGRTRVILDGHCRCSALMNLGCSRVAVRFVDYSSKDIEVKGWNGEEVGKEDVIRAGLSGNLMKPKTSRHIIRKGGRAVHISEICRNSPTLLVDLR